VETIKTASMVIVLMAVGYGVYTVLNQSQQTPSDLSMSGETGGLEIEMPPFASGSGTQIPIIEPIEADGSEFAPPYSKLANGGPLDSTETVASLPGLNESPAAITPLPTFDRATSGNPALSQSNSSTALNSGTSLYGNAQASVDSLPMGFTPINDSRQFELDWRSVELLLEKQEMLQALRLMSKWKNNFDLTSEQSDKLNRLLSQLAGTVVYSTDHLMSSPHIVSRGETLTTIASKYQVSPVLLQRINGLTATQILLDGQRLKVMQGPFDAKLYLSHSEIVLSVDKCYAGRFPISVISDDAVQAGNFSIIRKEENPDYFDAAIGEVLPATDPGNPYGQYRMNLDGGMSIHGTQGPTGGSISLSPRDIEDVYSILSVGSSVEVVR
jgi:LysM repeat protein